MDTVERRTAGLEMNCLFRCLVSALMLTTVMGNDNQSSMKSKHLTLSRHFQGDIFFGRGNDCSASHCSMDGDRAARPVRWGSCHCQCSADNPVFREDQSQCVNTIEECMLADYVNGANAEKVPFVFLPQKGHLINPNAEIALSDIRTEGHSVLSPVCVISKAHYLTQDGWLPVENSTTELPFALYRDAGRTYLQWLGETKLRVLLEGRILLVRLLCKDTTNARVGIFSPCIAFRVAGTPGFANASVLDDSSPQNNVGLKSGDYVAIGISAGLLGALYIAALVAFMCYRRRKRRKQTKHKKLVASPGSPVLEDGVIGANPFMHNRGHVLHPASGNIDAARASFNGIRHNPLFQDNGRRQTTAVVHPISAQTKQDGGNPQQVMCESEGSALYASNTFPQMDPAKQMYYGQQYIDPTLLKQSPPPAAMEFLSKIRGMMGAAKNKMTTRRFMPSLIDIPEEYGYGLAAQVHRVPSGNKGKSANSSELQRKTGLERKESRSDTESVYDTLRKGVANKINSLKRTVSRPFRHEQVEVSSLNDTAQILEEKLQEKSLEEKDLGRPDIRPAVIQKSPLPARQKTEPYALFGRQPSGSKPFVSIYTNPSIDDIYKSLGRKAEEPAVTHYDEPPPHTGKQTNPKLEEDSDSKYHESQEESDSESSYSRGDQTNEKYYEVDSLDRREANRIYNEEEIQEKPITVTDQYQKSPPRTHMYEKNARYKKPKGVNDTLKDKNGRKNGNNLSNEQGEPQNDRTEDSSVNEGYTSSASTTKSVKSLSRILPKEEEMMASNQLFNMNTGAKTLPRKHGKSASEEVEHIYERIGNNGGQQRTPDSPSSVRSFSSNSSSVQTVLEPSDKNTRRAKKGELNDPNEKKTRQKVSPSTSMEGHYDDFSSLTSSATQMTADDYETVRHEKLTVEVEDEDLFEPDTLERKNFHNRNNLRDFVDSLERPPRPDRKPSNPNLPKVLSVPAPVSPSSSSGLGSSDSPTSISPRPKDSGLLATVQSREPYEPENLPSKTASSAKNPPPRPPKGTSGPPQVPSRELKPVRVFRQTNSGVPRIPARREPAAPILPPKSVHSRSTLDSTSNSESRTSSLASVKHSEAIKKSLDRENSSSSESTGSDDSSDTKPQKSYNGHFMLGNDNQEDPKYGRSSFSVLQRIAEIEREESRAQQHGEAMTKGMEIALALKAKMDLEASLKDGRKSLSIKKTWRKFMEKVEDSFSETDCASSATSSIAGTLRLAPKPKVTPKNSDLAKRDSSGSDSASRSSSAFSSESYSSSTDTSKAAEDPTEEGDIESRSLGSDGTGEFEVPSSKTATLKSFYTFGEENQQSPAKGNPAKSFIYGHSGKRENINVTKPRRVSKMNIDESFDSGLHSSNYSTVKTTIAD